MVQPIKPPSNQFVRIARKVYNPIGFQKGYNFILWFVFAGALFGFALARLPYLNVGGVFCPTDVASQAAQSGECYFINSFDVYKVGIRLHLYMIIPAALLVVFQFVPAIRHKFILYHRIAGYLIILMSVISNIGALMIAKEAMGGTMATQFLIGFAALITTISLGLAIYNIKQLQIDQHRAWMLRTWFYMAQIITLRLIMVISANIISKSGEYYLVQPCAKVVQMINDDKALASLYPICKDFLSGIDLQARAIVLANVNGNNAEVSTAINLTFGASGWLALALHAVGVEIYLHLTPAESARLRAVSYQRQLEAGYKNPGNAGLTSQRLGDSKEYPTVRSSSPQHSDSFLGGTAELTTVVVDHDRAKLMQQNGHENV